MTGCTGCWAGLAVFLMQWGAVVLAVIIAAAGAWCIRALWRFDARGG